MKKPKREILAPSSIFIVSHGGYPFDVMVCIGASREEIISALKDNGVTRTVDELNAFQGNTQGRTWFLDNCHTILWLRNFMSTPKQVAHLAHECFHCVDEMFQVIGIRHSDYSCEAYAYAIEHLMNAILVELIKPPSQRMRCVLPEPKKGRGK